MVKICILSDTHGALDPRIADTVSQCDIAIHGGDIGNASVLEQLRPRGERVIAVLGNNDTLRKWPKQDREFLATIPERAELCLTGGSVIIEHGHRANPASQRHQRLRSRHPEARAIVYGHSHRLVCDLDLLPWILNPGAAGLSRTFGGPSCLVLHAGHRRWRVEPLRFEKPQTRPKPRNTL